MRNCVNHIFELLLGALLISLGLLYLMSQYKALTYLTEAITLKTIEDNIVYQQYSDTDINYLSDEEVCGAIMGHRDYPIMVDDNFVPQNAYDYTLYFSYLKDGNYKKEYQYNTNRHVVMIKYTYMGI